MQNMNKQKIKTIPLGKKAKWIEGKREEKNLKKNEEEKWIKP